MTLALRPNRDIDTALALAEQRYTARRPRSAEHMARARAVLPGGNTRTVLHFRPFPFVVTRSEGAHLTDLDGHSYLDFLGEYSAGLFGHSDPAIRAAIESALASGWVNGAHIENEARLAEALVARFPSIERVRFCNSGTEANLMALVTARVVTGRPAIMAFQGGYHGGVLMFKDGPAANNVPFPLVLGDYNAPERTRDLIRAHASELAAVIVEPMQGAGGCIPADPEFLHLLRDACTAAGALLIFDEVITSRLAPGGLQDVLGITPDLTTLGKYIGGGCSFGAFGGRADIMDRYDPGRAGALAHAGTFNNNAMTMAAGVVAMTDVFTAARVGPFNAAGDRLRARLQATADAAGVAASVTGRGSLMTIHLCGGPIRSGADADAADPRASGLMHLELIERGAYLARRGMIALSLPMTAADHDALVIAFAAFLDENGRLLAGLPDARQSRH